MEISQVEEQAIPENLVPAVERAARILLTFEEGSESYGISELSRCLEINKSTVYDILNTLTYYGFLERDEKTKKYRLGPTLLLLGNRVGAQLTVREVARPYLRELATELNQTVILGQLTTENDVLTVDAVVPEVAVAISTTVGRRLPHSAGALGKIFHAALSPEAFEQLLGTQGLHPFTERTIIVPEVYRTELESVRQNGYAVDDEEYLHGVRAVAAPIVDHDGQVDAALCVVGFSSHLTRAEMQELTQRVPSVAREISYALGAREYPSWDGVRQVVV
ncbi:MAG: IclR family transcriptional regulator [Chloroflexota bacterium]|nr:IclR family transcriptional regulator [Chloroflexota bacterium]